MNKEEQLLKLLAPYLDTPESDPFCEKIGYKRDFLNAHMYALAPKIFADPEGYGLPEALCKDIVSLSQAPEPNVIHWDTNVYYVPSVQTLTVRIPSLRCVGVYEDGSPITDFIGGNQLDLDLSPGGVDSNKCILRSTNGEMEIKLKNAPREHNPILVGKDGKDGIKIGEIAGDFDHDTAKERLHRFLSYPKLPAYHVYLIFGKRNFDPTCDFLVSIMQDIAEKNKLYTEPNYKKDCEKLKKRKDFAYEKDFHDIYPNCYQAFKPNKIVAKGR